MNKPSPRSCWRWIWTSTKKHWPRQVGSSSRRTVSLRPKSTSCF
ncbi:hypothetical protein S7711_11599 [Stachybotrys chartarum IBT 7711]|uniref:Uncharacterized protein n=1 Tax=Stachybotrys chartarum (strain CBS 109288 / IBT 7711) TaxID=1280523 RepID=A0A084B286_STACB|nr:hypothetical protein S7711_11599 [Stachybotrys chartarum IBT 7711]